jgi:arginyl-tRNA synthetase
MIRDQIIKATQKASGVKDVRLETPEIELHGDYTTNVALKLKTQNSKLKAKEIVQKLVKDEKLSSIVSKIEVAGPGFINFWLTGSLLVSEMKEVLEKKDKYGSLNFGKGKIAIVEYSSPNIAKSFSVGHLRSTIIGQAIYNILGYVGYKTIGDNHIGDWGTQFGMIIFQIVRKKIDPKKLTIDDFERLYVELNKESQEKPELREEGKKWFKKLEDGDKKARNIWEIAVANSMKEFDKIYDLLGVKIDNAYGESFYGDKMQDVIKLLRKKNISKKSEGAEIVELDGLSPAILLKGDGGTTYYTRDLATVKFRVDKWDPAIILYEVGSEQKLHFKQIFETSKLMGWSKDRELIHIAHGLFLYKGKKMSTRKGTTIKLEQIMEDAIKRARKIVEESETGKDLSYKKKDEIAKAVGVGAVKYFDLLHHYSSDINFDWEQTMALQGNSGPYLQYTFARTNSVLAKRKTQSLELNTTTKNLKFNREEKLLLRSFVHFPEVVQESAKNYAPNLLCNYLFDLAQKFNNFYNSHRILAQNSKLKTQNDEMLISVFRLALTQATGQMLKNGLRLLGIQTPEKM